MTENQVSEQQSLSTEDVQKMWDEEAIAMVEDPVDPTPEPEPEPEPAPKLESDPFRDLPPELLARIDSLHKANEDLKNHVRAAEGRVAAWQREREEQKLAAPTQNELVKATANPEKWEQLKQDFPEWAEAMEEYVSAKVGSSAQGVPTDQLNQLLEYGYEEFTAQKLITDTSFEQFKQWVKHHGGTAIQGSTKYESIARLWNRLYGYEKKYQLMELKLE